MGIGKSTICNQLNQDLDHSVFLDGDWCWNMDPFIVNQDTTNMVLDNITHCLNNFIHTPGIENIIFCWVMHKQDIIDQIIQKLDTEGVDIHLISLICEKEELIKLFDEFEAFETAESKFAHAMDNLQPLILNNSNGGGDWREHGVTARQVYGRQSKTKLGSERLYEVTDKLIQENINKGNIKAE